MYCDVCRVWIANHSVAVRNHENGAAHKEKLAESASPVARCSFARALPPRPCACCEHGTAPPAYPPPRSRRAPSRRPAPPAACTRTLACPNAQHARPRLTRAELQGMRRKAQDEERQLEEARRAMGAIEAEAARAYGEDVAAAVRPEDQLGPALPGAWRCVLALGFRA